MPQQKLGILMAKSRWVILTLMVPWLFHFFLTAVVAVSALKQHYGSWYSEVLILEYIGEKITSLCDYWLITSPFFDLLEIWSVYFTYLFILCLSLQLYRFFTNYIYFSFLYYLLCLLIGLFKFTVQLPLWWLQRMSHDYNIRLRLIYSGVIEEESCETSFCGSFSILFYECLLFVQKFFNLTSREYQIFIFSWFMHGISWIFYCCVINRVDCITQFNPKKTY